MKTYRWAKGILQIKKDLVCYKLPTTTEVISVNYGITLMPYSSVPENWDYKIMGDSICFSRDFMDSVFIDGKETDNVSIVSVEEIHE